MPLVSVCIAAYNSADYIEETLDCLFKQTYAKIEVIVVDDGSTDGTERILRKVDDHRFKYFKRSNAGASASRNIAYKNSTGDYIKFMDSDDLINRECIKTQLIKIKARNDCIASAKWGRFYLKDISTFKLNPESVWRDLRGIDWIVESLIEYGRNMMQCGIFLIPRGIIERAGLWNEGLSLIDDFEYMIRVIANSTQVLFCEDALLMYRSGIDNNLSGQKSRKHMESAFNATSLGVSTILAFRNDPESRLACANTYQEWAYQFYPEQHDLYQKSLEKIQELGGSTTKLGGGKIYQLFAKLLGWERAKKYKKNLLGHY